MNVGLGASCRPTAEFRAHTVPTTEDDSARSGKIETRLPKARSRVNPGLLIETERDRLNLFGFKSHRHRQKTAVQE